jgi:hypothetical protein
MFQHETCLENPCSAPAIVHNCHEFEKPATAKLQRLRETVGMVSSKNIVMAPCFSDLVSAPKVPKVEIISVLVSAHRTRWTANALVLKTDAGLELEKELLL